MGCKWKSCTNWFICSFELHKKHWELVVHFVSWFARGVSFVLTITVSCGKQVALKLVWTGQASSSSVPPPVCVCSPLPSFLMHTELSCSVYTLWITDAVNALPCHRFTLLFCTRLYKFSLYKCGFCNIHLIYDVQAVLFIIWNRKTRFLKPV